MLVPGSPDRTLGQMRDVMSDKALTLPKPISIIGLGFEHERAQVGGSLHLYASLSWVAPLQTNQSNHGGIDDLSLTLY